MANFIQNEELVSKVAKNADALFSRFKSDREQWDEVIKVADYMFKAAQNRTINSSEKSKGANLDDDGRANVGSTMFHRQVNQRAAAGVSVMWSKDLPAKYVPIINENNTTPPEMATAEAEQMNVLLKWGMKKDGFRKKSVDMWHQLAKYSHVPVMIYQRVDKGKRTVTEPQYSTLLNEETGQKTQIVIGKKTYEKEYKINNYPSIEILPISNVYMDAYIGDVQKQNLVVVLTPVNKSEIWDDCISGVLDKSQYEKITEKHAWDGSTHSELRQKLVENSDKTYDASSISKLYLRWDIFYRLSLGDSDLDDTKPPTLHCLTFIGNSMAEGICMRFERNKDPDDEIPIEMLRENPDDSDMLYHVLSAEIIRSNYSVECTLKGLAIDNMAMVNNPPVMAVEGLHRVTDFRFKKGAFWPVHDINAIKEFQVRDCTQQTVPLLEYVQADTMQALATDKPLMGESFGARTSATEANNIYSNTVQPHLVKIRYVLDQLLPWYARKFRSYIRAFSDNEQIIRITGENIYPEIRPKDIAGDFEIEVDVVDEYEANIVQEQKMNGIIQMLVRTPILLKSATHEVDIAELVSEIFKKAKINNPRLVRRKTSIDSSRIARMENIAIMEEGVEIEPRPEEDHDTHISVHDADILRYNGVREQYEPRVTNLEIHKEKHVRMRDEQGVQQNSSPDMVSGNQTPGEVAGNSIAAAAGAQAGGYG